MAEFLMEIQGRLTREKPEPDERNLHQEGHDNSPSEDQVGDPQTVCPIHIPSPMTGEKGRYSGTRGCRRYRYVSACPSAGSGGKRDRTGGTKTRDWVLVVDRCGLSTPLVILRHGNIL